MLTWICITKIINQKTKNKKQTIDIQFQLQTLNNANNELSFSRTTTQELVETKTRIKIEDEMEVIEIVKVFDIFWI